MAHYSKAQSLIIGPVQAGFIHFGIRIYIVWFHSESKGIDLPIRMKSAFINPTEKTESLVKGSTRFNEDI